MLKMRATTAIRGDCRPLVAQNSGFGFAEIHHWLNRENHSLAQSRSVTACAVVRNLRLFMQPCPDPVTDKLTYYAESGGFNMLLHCRANISHRVPDPHVLDSSIQGSLGHFQQLLDLRLQSISHRHCDRRVSVVAVEHHDTIDRYDVAFVQN